MLQDPARRPLASTVDRFSARSSPFPEPAWRSKRPALRLTRTGDESD
ncbi:MAG: hypothetical protein ACLFS4_00400 [Opitutales bacterium]